MKNRKDKIKKEKAPRNMDGAITARLNIARNGTGFVLDPETDEAVWIDERDLGTALPGDIVVVRRISAGGRSKLRREHERKSGPEGRIVSIESSSTLTPFF